MHPSLPSYIKAFTRLRRASTNGGAPHKPVLLLSVLQLVAHGEVERGQVCISPELVALFRSNWKQLVTTRHDPLMALPFFYMKSEGFWKLVPRSGMFDLEGMGSFTKSLAKLDATIAYAQLDDALFTLMRDPEANHLLQQAILQRYFPEQTVSGYGPLGGQADLFSELRDKMLHEPAAIYRTEIDRLLQEDEDEVFLRGGVFKREVPKVYDYRCAISGMRISAVANISMVDACHIVPFSESHDDTIGNGLALCPTLHRAFDRGLIAIAPDYRVLVSGAFHEQAGDYGIRRFEGRELQLPSDKAYWPGQGNLEWHRRRFGF